MKKNVYVSVSTDPVEAYQDIIEYAKSLQYDADFLHCDIMDGTFVPKYTYDYALVKNINANTVLPLDVHLMVNEPKKDLESYVKAGANIITLHYEAFEQKNDLIDALNFIKQNECLAGISLKPGTDFKSIKPYCYNVDVVLVMSVEPGLSGQKFLSDSLKKIKEIDQFRKENDLSFKIEVDGGVNLENAKKLVDAGVDILVSGSCVFKSNDRKNTILKLKN